MENNSVANESRVVNWGYIPEIKTLCQYLNRSDLIEFGKTCKYYRKRVERAIIEKLYLVKYCSILESREYYKSSNNKSLYLLLKLLEEDLGSKLKYVKEVSFFTTFKDEFAIKFVKLLPNIKKLKFSSPYYEGSYLSLSILLNGLKKLEHVEFFVRPTSTLFFHVYDMVFPKSLKSLKAYTVKNQRFYLPILETINSSYINLTTLTITSSILLEKISKNSMPNLKEVEILSYWDFDEFKFLEFFGNNPQITKLKTQFDQLNTEILNSILSSESLKYWCIYKDGSSELENINFPLNFSIEHLNIQGDIDGKIILNLINACQNLNTIEFTKRDFYNEQFIEWDKLDRRVNSLRFHKCHFSTSYIQILEKFKFFNFSTFILGYNMNGMLNESNIGQLNNYRVISTGTRKSEIFTIAKIS